MAFRSSILRQRLAYWADFGESVTGEFHPSALSFASAANWPAGTPSVNETYHLASTGLGGAQIPFGVPHMRDAAGPLVAGGANGSPFAQRAPGEAVENGLPGATHEDALTAALAAYGDGDPFPNGFLPDPSQPPFQTSNGFYADVLRNAQGQYIIAIRGTEDVIGVVAAAELGLYQYRAIQAELLAFVASIATQHPELKSNVDLVTFNGIGSEYGLKNLHPEGIDPFAIHGMDATHIGDPDDPTQWLGGHHLSGDIRHIMPSPGGLGLNAAHDLEHFKGKLSSSGPAESRSYDLPV